MSEQTDWTERYRPASLSELRGNDTACEELETWAHSWDDHGEAVICHGSPGVGKTSAAHALAADEGWEVMELNASDARKRDQIERIAGGAAMNQSLGTVATDQAGRQLLILDEADNLHQHKDRGGAGAMTSLAKAAHQPVILIANDLYEMSRGLRRACQEIEFRDVSARSILPALRDISRREAIDYEEGVLERLAERNAGDLRGAINDLQAVADGRERLAVEHLSTGSRDRSVGLFSLLDGILKESSAQEALEQAYDADETPEEMLRWIEDKVAKVYEGPELATAYEFLSNADRWQGRVRATQNYSYWRYIADNVAAGVASARDSERGGWTRYGGYPYRSSRNSTRDHVAQQIAEGEGVSIATARRVYLPYLAAMIEYCKPRETALELTARYDLDASHLAHVSGSGKTTNKVEGIVEEAAAVRAEAAVAHGGDAFAPPAPGTEHDAESSSEAALADQAASDPGEAEADSSETEPDAADAEADDDSQAGLSDFI